MSTSFAAAGFLRTFFAFSALCLMTACAFNPQQVNLSPAIGNSTSDVGKGITVAVKVADERATKHLGYRGFAYGNAAQITAKQDVAAVVRDTLVASLERKGFKVTAYDDRYRPNLVFEVRLLEYVSTQNLFTFTIRVNSTIKATARNNKEAFEKTYRAENSEDVAIVPTAEANERWINKVFSDILNQIVEDEALYKFLKQVD